VASRQEIEHCLSRGIPPSVLSFGNTIKKERDIA
jgi:ornithine decarboxylase